VRRPWCLSCCEELDRDCRVIPFDSTSQDITGLGG
jgi:hypothetical protein